MREKLKILIFLSKEIKLQVTLPITILILRELGRTNSIRFNVKKIPLKQ